MRGQSRYSVRVYPHAAGISVFLQPVDDPGLPPPEALRGESPASTEESPA